MTHSITPDLHVNENLSYSINSESTPKLKAFIEADPSVHIERFTKVPNTLVDNLNISIEAKWLLVYLLRQAPGWVFYRAVILKHMGYGREKVEQLFSELSRAGYVKYTLIKNASGKIVGKQRHFARDPIYLDNRTTEKTCDGKENRTTELPCQGKPVHNKKTITIDKKTNNNIYVPQAEPCPHSLIPKGAIQAFFQQWQLKFDHPKAQLDARRAAKIEKALKIYGWDDCIKALEGCKLTPFNMGENDNKRKYDDIELILRNSSNIERFIETAALNSAPKITTIPKERF